MTVSIKKITVAMIATVAVVLSSGPVSASPAGGTCSSGQVMEALGLGSCSSGDNAG
jgi:hypothetical protein